MSTTTVTQTVHFASVRETLKARRAVLQGRCALSATPAQAIERRDHTEV